MCYCLWIYGGDYYILNKDTGVVYDYDSEEVIGHNMNGVLIKY